MPEQFYDAATYLARDSVGYLVRRLYSILSSRIESAFASHDFTLTQWGVLMHLRDGLAHTASDLADAFQHDSGALTRVLDQLERRGLVRRARSTRDRRVVELEVTAEGRRVITRLLPTVVDEMNAALAPLDRKEFEQFRDVLRRILDHLQTGPEAGRPAPGAKARPSPAAGGPATHRRASPRRARARSARS